MAGMRWSCTIFPFNKAASITVGRLAPEAKFPLRKTAGFVNFLIYECGIRQKHASSDAALASARHRPPISHGDAMPCQ